MTLKWVLLVVVLCVGAPGRSLAQEVIAEPAVVEPDYVIGEPELMAEEPEIVTGNPEMSTGEPGLMNELLDIMTGEPSLTTEEPGKEMTTEQTILPTKEPTQVTPEPTQETSEPTQVTPEPTQVTPEPTPVTPEPTQVTPEPTPVTTEPPQVTTEPTQVTPEPTQQTTEKPGPGKPSPTLDQLILALINARYPGLNTAKQIAAIIRLLTNGMLVPSQGGLGWSTGLAPSGLFGRPPPNRWPAARPTPNVFGTSSSSWFPSGIVGFLNRLPGFRGLPGTVLSRSGGGQEVLPQSMISTAAQLGSSFAKIPIDLGQQLATTGLNLADKAMHLGVGLVDTGINKATDVGKTVNEAVSSTLAKVIQSGSNAIKEGMGAWRDFPYLEPMTSVVHQMVDKVASGAGKAVTLGNELGSAVMDAAKVVGQAGTGLAKEVTSSGLGAARTALNAGAQRVQTAIDAGARGVQQMVDAGVNRVQSLASAGLNAITGSTGSTPPATQPQTAA